MWKVTEYQCQERMSLDELTPDYVLIHVHVSNNEHQNYEPWIEDQ